MLLRRRQSNQPATVRTMLNVELLNADSCQLQVLNLELVIQRFAVSCQHSTFSMAEGFPMQIIRSRTHLRRLHRRLRRRRRHGRQGADRGRRQRRHARGRADVEPVERLEHVRVALRFAAARRGDREAAVRRVRRRVRRLDARGRAVHERHRQPRSTGSARGCSAAAPTTGAASRCASVRTISGARASTASATTGRSPTTT